MSGSCSTNPTEFERRLLGQTSIGACQKHQHQQQRTAYTDIEETGWLSCLDPFDRICVFLFRFPLLRAYHIIYIYLPARTGNTKGGVFLFLFLEVEAPRESELCAGHIRFDAAAEKASHEHFDDGRDGDGRDVVHSAQSFYLHGRISDGRGMDALYDIESINRAHADCRCGFLLPSRWQRASGSICRRF